MRELLPTLEKWFEEGKQVAVATVVQMSGSAPRGLGSKMAVNSEGQMTGSVSGGCVEGAVVQEALDVIKTQKAKLLAYGISFEQAFSVGLSCGGKIEVFVRPLSFEEFKDTQNRLQKGSLFAQISILTGDEIGKVSMVEADRSFDRSNFTTDSANRISETLSELFMELQNKRFSIGEVDAFYNVYPPLSRLVIIGAAHIAIPLVTYAKMLGFQTIVVDPRKAFSNRERFPHADELIQSWPQDCLPGLNLDEGTYFVTLSHDDKLDVPGLEIACRSKARYIGTLGSKKTFERRKQDMLELGVSEEQISRVHSPIGLKIGSQGAEEIALSIIAEIVAVRNGALP